jgi:hypothetical protein
MKEHLKGKIGEDAVNEVAEKTYLKYWCFPGPRDELKDKKEICDLLILFKETALIISIKNYEFKGNYERYFRSTLDKAISQIQGAERKLFDSQYDIVFNHPTKGEHKFDPKKYSVVQRLIINLSTVPLFYPGGTLTSKGNFIHIFNWFAFLKVVNELDTIPDFIDYLIERENTFKEKQIVILPGKEDDWSQETHAEFVKYSEKLNPTEKPFVLFSGNELDLLATYLFNGRVFNDYFKSNESNTSFLQYDGKWEEYILRKEVVRKKEADQISYFIDEFIEREVLYYNDDNRIEMATELLGLSRFERRVVGKHFFEFIDRYKFANKFDIARRYGKMNDIIISFFVHGSGIDLERAMTMMNVAVLGYAYWEGYKTKKIIMIGCNSELTQFKFLYSKEIEPLPFQQQEDLIHDLKLLNWFEKMEEIKFPSKEYPDA